MPNMKKYENRFSKIVYLCFFASLIPLSPAASKPNIVLILTDDQDYELNSLEAMPKLRQLIATKGVEFTNMFVSTPMCCCSRSVIFSGGCVDEFWLTEMEPKAFPALVKAAGYKTFYAGKYLNRYGEPASGGPSHIPPGWDWWNALIGDSYFYNYPMSVNGTAVHHGNAIDDYMTNVIRQHAGEFLKWTDASTPFFMVMAPTAPHTPADYIPPYDDLFANLTAPRTPHYGKHSPDKHWVVRHMPVTMPDDTVKTIDYLFSDTHWIVRHMPVTMPDDTVKTIDYPFRRRWRSLQSVDDLVEEVITTLSAKGLLDNTYVIYTADNGYQLGQFNLPYDKRHPYEFDVRVPLMVRGPGVPRGQKRAEPVMNLDLGPTILTLAGVDVPDYFEGLSFKKFLENDLEFVYKTESKKPNEYGEMSDTVQYRTVGKSDQSSQHQNDQWRSSFLIEYHGETDQNEGCIDPNLGCCLAHCICVDARNNTYSCVRTVTNSENTAYCEMDDAEHFTEFYDLNKDRYQMTNMFSGLPDDRKKELHKLLVELKTCVGSGCRIF